MRPAHRAGVAPARHRQPRQRRSVQRQPQLRLHQHHLLAQPVDAAAPRSTTRAWCSSRCSATAAAPIRPAPAPGCGASAAPAHPLGHLDQSLGALGVVRDLHVLLDTKCEPPSAAAYRSLVIDDNCIARKSAAARRKIWKELKSRYILDTGHPLFAAFLQEWRRCRSEPERGLTATCSSPSTIVWSPISAPAGCFRSCDGRPRSCAWPTCSGSSSVRQRSARSRRLVGSHAPSRGPEICRQRPRLRVGERHGQEGHGPSRSLRRAGPPSRPGPASRRGSSARAGTRADIPAACPRGARGHRGSRRAQSPRRRRFRMQGDVVELDVEEVA